MKAGGVNCKNLKIICLRDYQYLNITNSIHSISRLTTCAREKAASEKLVLNFEFVDVILLWTLYLLIS